MTPVAKSKTSFSRVVNLSPSTWRDKKGFHTQHNIPCYKKKKKKQSSILPIGLTKQTINILNSSIETKLSRSIYFIMQGERKFYRQILCTNKLKTVQYHFPNLMNVPLKRCISDSWLNFSKQQRQARINYIHKTILN